MKKEMERDKMRSLDEQSHNLIQKILNEIKPFVYVVGSVAEGTDDDFSDIDFYVKLKPQSELDKEIEANFYSLDGIDESYLEKIIDVLNDYKIKWSSSVISYITTENAPVQLEFSTLFNIKNKTTSTVSVYGVKMNCYK